MKPPSRALNKVTAGKTAILLLGLTLCGCSHFAERRALLHAGHVPACIDSELVEALRTATPTFRE